LTDGSGNTAAGNASLAALANGEFNTTMGAGAFVLLTSGNSNVGIGFRAGLSTASGSDLTLIGTNSEAVSGLTNATALGSRARVDQNNSLVLGSINGVNGATSDTRVGIGTTAPDAALDVVHHVGLGFTGSFTRFASGDGPIMRFRTARGTSSAPAAVLANDNLLFLAMSGHTGTGFTTQKAFVVTEASEDWTDTANGTRWRFSTTANGTSTVLERMRIDHSGNVGIGALNPLARLHVAGGTVRVDSLGVAGATTLCRNASNEIATCSSSLRYKRDVEAFDGGLDVLGRLRPISFTWKNGGMRDLGFGAEDVAAIDPRLAVFNGNGEVEGVKYDRLTTVLVNAVKELEELVRTLREEKSDLERRLTTLEGRMAEQPRE
jgi:trimeric autotransporter adhesin